MHATGISGLPHRSILYVSATVHPEHPLHRTFRRWVDPAPDYDLGRAVKSIGEWIRPYFIEQVVDGTQQELPTDLSGYRGVVVGCSLHYVNADREPIAPWQQRIMDLIRRAVFDYELPFLGLCGGGQLGLTALGGRVGPNPLGTGMAPDRPGSLVVRSTDVELTEAGRNDAIFRGCPDRLSMVAIHSDYLADAPASAGFVPLAHSQDIPNQVLAWGERVRLFGIHPEMSSDFVRKMARYVVETGAFGPHPRETLYQAVETMSSTEDATSRVLSNFLQHMCSQPDDPNGQAKPRTEKPVVRSVPRTRIPAVANKLRTNAPPSASATAWYPTKLVPLLTHQRVHQAPRDVQDELCVRQLLSYFHFTVHLEQGPVGRVTQALAGGELLPWLDADARAEANTICTEEAGHADIHLEAIERVCTATGVQAPVAPPAFLRRLASIRRSSHNQVRSWVDMLFVMVSETLITGNLTLLRRAREVRQWVRRFAAHHAQDEARHHAFFRRLFGSWWQRLKGLERRLLGPLVPELLHAYLAPVVAEMSAHLAGWPGLFPDRRAIAKDVCASTSVHQAMVKAAAPTVQMCRAAGLLDDPTTAMAFVSSGLVGSMP